METSPTEDASQSGHPKPQQSDADLQKSGKQPDASKGLEHDIPVPDVANAYYSQPILAQPLATLTGLRLAERATIAAGLQAVIQSMAFNWREAGLSRGGRGLLSMNQKDGFDCSGCAWPDPDGHRSIAEFCENGAKATASDADDRAAVPH